MNETIPLHRRTVDKLYDMQLQRDVAIVNARTTAELGPLPSGGVPVVPKRRPNVEYDKLRANQTIDSEDDDMSMKKTISAAAVAVGLAACQPTAGKPPSQPAASAAPQAASAKDISARDVLQDSAAKDAAAQPVPEEVREFVPDGSTLLAYKKFDLTGDGVDDAVIIVRHPVLEQYANYKNNPCDLIVLHGKPEGFEVAAKSSKVIDCTYQTYSRETAADVDDLNYLLELSANEITYVNESEKPSTSKYKFLYSKNKKQWHLAKAENNYQTFDTRKDLPADVSEVVNYPKDIPWITINDFDPDFLKQFFLKNRNVEYSYADSVEDSE